MPSEDGTTLWFLVNLPEIKVFAFDDVFDQIKKQLVSYNYVQDELHPHRIGLGQGIPGIVLSDGQPIITNAPKRIKTSIIF